MRENKIQGKKIKERGSGFDERGLFIVFEGPEGSGKSTQIKLLSGCLQGQGLKVVFTREPGGTEAGDVIRGILQAPDIALHPRAELLLFKASRAQHVEEVIRPALEKGRVVISDRFSGSTLAYQHFARKVVSRRDFDTFDVWTRGGIEPDLNILLDIDVETGLSRGKGSTRFEKEKLGFHKKLRAGYQELAVQNPHNWVMVDTNNKDIDTVQKEVRKIIVRLLNK